MYYNIHKIESNTCIILSIGFNEVLVADAKECCSYIICSYYGDTRVRHDNRQ